MKKNWKWLIPLLLLSLLLTSCQLSDFVEFKTPDGVEATSGAASLEEIPEFFGEPYIVLKNNVPDFNEDEFTDKAYEDYSPLDDLGRCGAANACVGTELMPTEERGSIGPVKPAGWHTVKYDCVDGKYLYNRCHLIGYQLSGENANERNLITGTRYLNVEGMLPFENMVADYVKQTGNHVRYRVTPVYTEDELLARGVTIEAQSVEDDTICLYVYCYNAQPGIVIDYQTGESWEDTDAQEGQETETGMEGTYVLNLGRMKFHAPDCAGAAQIKPENRKEYVGPRQALIEQGYSPCGQCNP